MKKLILSLTLVAFVSAPAAFAGEGKECAQSKAACSATAAKAACSATAAKASCSATAAKAQCCAAKAAKSKAGSKGATLLVRR